MRLQAASSFALLVVLASGCASKGEDASTTLAASTAVEEPTLDCTQLGSFPEAAMLGIGEGTYVRAESRAEASVTAASASLDHFTLGPLIDVPGWGGKKAEYTRDANQTGTITVIMDNPAIGAVITFEDGAEKSADDAYFITASSVVDGKTTALCLASPATGDRFLMKRQ